MVCLPCLPQIIEDLDVYHGKHLSKVVQFTVPYQGDEDGLPNEDEYEKIINRLFKILAQLTALPNVFFAGTLFATIRQNAFYCEHDALLKETLQQLDFVSEINVQDDPNWDTYFDFLLASPLEMKLNATEEILSMLNSKGRNLSDTYLIEHTFHFDEKKNVPFMDELTLGKVSFNTLKYSSQAIQTEEDEQPYFMVKLEQELSLDSNEIFDWVERFEN